MPASVAVHLHRRQKKVLVDAEINGPLLAERRVTINCVRFVLSHAENKLSQRTGREGWGQPAAPKHLMEKCLVRFLRVDSEKDTEICQRR